MSAQIPLSQNRIALIDDDEFRRISLSRWCYRAERNNRQGYAVRHVKVDGKNRLMYLHRDILAAPPGYEVIFLNHDRLDCRKVNLVVATKAEARQHHCVRSDRETGQTGANYNRDGSWTAYFTSNGRFQTLGTFNFKKEAVEACDAAALREYTKLYVAPDIVERIDDQGLVQQA